MEKGLVKPHTRQSAVKIDCIKPPVLSAAGAKLLQNIIPSRDTVTRVGRVSPLRAVVIQLQMRSRGGQVASAQ